jgi:hypothetical protein
VFLFQNGMRDWMLIEKHLVDFSGLTCNRIGLYYEGFANQPGQCRRKINRLDFYAYACTCVVCITVLCLLCVCTLSWALNTAFVV